jgi:hypothetical protein
VDLDARRSAARLLGLAVGVVSMTALVTHEKARTEPMVLEPVP